MTFTRKKHQLTPYKMHAQVSTCRTHPNHSTPNFFLTKARIGALSVQHESTGEPRHPRASSSLPFATEVKGKLSTSTSSLTAGCGATSASFWSPSMTVGGPEEGLLTVISDCIVLFDSLSLESSFSFFTSVFFVPL